MWGLTELGFVVKLDVSDKKDTTRQGKVKIIEDAIVLDIENATFSIDYSAKYGELVKDTITENPKEIYDRLSSARLEIEKRELALMKNLFLIDKSKLTLTKLIKPKRKSKKITNLDDL